MDVRRALFLSWYDEAGPSSRVRFYQYFPHLAEHGLACEAAPLFPRRYVETFFTTGRRPLGVVLRAYLDRLRSMRRLRDYDVLVIEKELLPYLPAPFERRLRSSGVPIVADYDDAVHHRYDRSRNPVVRALLATKIARLMRAADAVIVGNPYLRTYAEAAGARRVELLPSVVDLAKYPRDRAPPDGPFTIAWIGSRTTAPYLGLAEPALARVLRAGERVRVVGPRAPALRVPVEERPWSEATEAADLASSHAGIMPLPDTPWERGKCGYKIVQYMAAGLPVVASPVGVNRDLVEPGRNGFLAAGTDEWVEALTRLRDEPKLAEWMGREGRAKVERDYSVEANAPRFARLLRELEVGS